MQQHIVTAICHFPSIGVKPLQQEQFPVSAGVKTKCLVISNVLSAKNLKFTTMTTQDPNARALRFLYFALPLSSTLEMKVTVYYIVLLN